VLSGLAALLRAVPETVTDRWTLASWLRLAGFPTLVRPRSRL